MISPAVNPVERFSQAVANTEGWFAPDLLEVILSISELQWAAGCRGWLVEWGVHHGRGLAALALAAGPNDHVLGIDCFDRQELNRCGSGMGNLAATRRTLDAVLGPDHQVCLHSTDLRSFGTPELVKLLRVLPGGNAPIRIAHIDGDHTESGAMNDLGCAQAAMDSFGIVLLDDVFNPDWPEVGAAFHQFLARHGEWRAVGWAYGRAVLCRDEVAGSVQQVLKKFRYRKAVLRDRPFIVLEWQ
ncbi:MAG: class I SAM-dependent methyltransferase [Verrucomicrobiales bacterium]|nr:class I SAM-dependent methyltransferase [Verrucomicrobiales bacterium]